MNTSKFVGSTMILIGTIVGAGMLLLPTSAAASGFMWPSILMFILWLASTVTGLLIIEINLAMPIHACSFGSMAKNTLGNSGKVITWLSYLFLLYAIITLYVIGGANLIGTLSSSILNFKISSSASALLFTTILGAAVFWSTRAVDYLNRNLISVKGLLLLVTLVLVMPHIDINKLMAPQNINQTKYLLAALPTFVCAFGYHFVIPSLRIYIGDKPRQLKVIVITGTTVALIIYLWWLAAAFGTIPIIGDNSFSSIASKPAPSGLIQLMSLLINNKWITASINGFASFALTTSFLGAALGLFDFLAEGFKRSDTRFGRLQTAGLTFIPPLIIAFYFPNAFNIAINYATIPLAVLTLILPALMVYYLRKNKEFKSPYRVKCGNLGLALIILLGLISIVTAIMYIFHLLPMLQ